MVVVTNLPAAIPETLAAQGLEKFGAKCGLVRREFLASLIEAWYDQGGTVILALLSACAWALHSTYAVSLIGLGIFALSLVTGSIPWLNAFSLLTYVSQPSPHPVNSLVAEHLGICVVMVLALGWLATSVAGRQEWISNQGRDPR